MGTFIALELKRVLRDPATLAFTIGIPVLMYVIFGVGQEWGSSPIGRGNASMMTMINLACYGAVTATTGVGGLAAVERLQGWGRQLGLTPMTDSAYVIGKAVVGTLVAAVPIIIVYVVGALTSARAPLWVWLASGAITVGGSMLFSLYGMAIGSTFRSESAVGISSGMLVLFGFLGNVFLPLSGIMLTIAKFTPLYGVGVLARRPLTDGHNVDMQAGTLVSEPLLPALVNVVAWLVIFSVAAVVLVRRGRGRQ